MTLIDIANFVNLQNIPILGTGIEYPASTGPVTFSSELLLEIVRSQEDPNIPAPRIKIGHADNPLDAEIQEIWENLNTDLGRDSEPALGTIFNMRTEEDDQLLVGDFFGLPEWLAAILETAYPARSIEGGPWGNTANLKQYAYAIQAVALLGVAWPGCTSLEDLQVLFSKDGPKVTVIELPSQKPKVKMEGGRMPVVAQVNVEDIRRAFYDVFAQGDRYWWWDRELMIDPNEFIVEDPDEGQLYRLAFSLGDGDGPDTVTFGDPKPVKIKYVNDPKKKTEDTQAQVCLASQLEGAGVVLAVNTTPPRSSERQNRRTPAMAVNIPALRERLGLTAEQLPDDASEEQVNEVLENPPQPSPDPAPPPNPEGTPPPGSPESAPNEGGGEGTLPENPGAAGPDGGSNLSASGVTIDRATWEQTQRQAQEGAELAATHRREERTRFVEAAINDGRIPPSRRGHYVALMERDDQGTREFLSGLQPGSVVPTIEMGVDPGGGKDGPDYLDTHLTPEERSRIAAAAAGTTVDNRIVTEAI